MRAGWVIGIVIACIGLAPIESADARTGPKTTVVRYRTTAMGENGYQGAIVNVVYGFDTCPGEQDIALVYQIQSSTFQPSELYSFEGKTYHVSQYPPVRSSTQSVPFIGRVMHGGATLGSFMLTADGGGAACWGNSWQVGTKVRDLLGEKYTPEEKERLLDILTLSLEDVPAYRDVELEARIRRQLDAEEKQRKEAEDRAKKEAADKELAEKKAADEKAADEKKNGSQTATGENAAEGTDDKTSDGASTDGNGSTDDSSTDPKKSGSGSSKGTIVGGAGAAVAAGGGIVSEGQSDDTDEAPPSPRGPSTLTPVLGSLGGLLTGGIGLLTFLAWEKALALRLDEERVRLDVGCRSDTATCARRDELAAHLDHASTDWSLDAVFGPSAAYRMGVGYMREHHAGRAGSDFPVGLDGTVEGLTVELAVRVRFLRFHADYHHLRGNLLGTSTDFGNQYQLSETQGIDGVSLGIAAQLGFHHLVAPYAGFKFRYDVMSGHFDANGREYTLDGLEGATTVASIGAAIQLPVKRSGVMSQGPSLNVELYRSLSSDRRKTLDGGALITFGYSAWIEPWVSKVEGITGVAPGDDTIRGNALMPYVGYSGSVGGGLQLMLVEAKNHYSWSAFDIWFSPGGTSGFSAINLGAVFPLTPDNVHAIGFRFGILAAQWGGVLRDGMDKDVIGFGAFVPYYRANVHNHTVEASLKMPLVWGITDFSADEDVGLDLFAGLPPLMLSVGVGY